MPELPEVEVARRNLERWFAGRRVVRTEADPTRIFRGAEAKAFASLRGKLVSADRKGKYLLLSFDKDRGLLSHLGMTGKFVRRPEGKAEPYSRARFFLDSGDVIHYRDPRMFGRMEPVAASKLMSLPVVKELGVDLWKEKVGAALLQERVGSTRQPVKVALMDQTRLAGLGNIHAVEALFRAGIHPSHLPKSLTPKEWTALSKAIRTTLAFGLRHTQAEEVRYVEEGGDVKNPFFVYAREGEPCLRCKTPIQSFRQAGRSTFYCPKCQPKKKG